MTTAHSVLVPLELDAHEKIQRLRIHTGLRTCDIASLLIEEALKDPKLMKIAEERAKELGKETN